MAEAAFAVNRSVLILVHGGPIAEPDDAAYVLGRAKHCHGFYGASSMERLPVERALVEQVAKFKTIGKTQHSLKQSPRQTGGRRAGRK